MHRQAVAGDGNHAFALRHARGDHPPADRPLNATQSARDQQFAGPAGRDLARHQEAEEPKRPDQTDHAAQLAVAPFPPVDEFEIV